MDFCNKCNNTGATTEEGYLDCIAPGCHMADKRTAFDKALLQQGYPQSSTKEWWIYLHAERTEIELARMLLKQTDRLRWALEELQQRMGQIISEKTLAEQRVADLSALLPASPPSKESAVHNAYLEAVERMSNESSRPVAAHQHTQAANETESRIASQVSDWRREIARLQDLVEHATGNAQAAQQYDFAKLMMYPQEWDTAAYPTLESAMWEAISCAQIASAVDHDRDAEAMLSDGDILVKWEIVKDSGKFHSMAIPTDAAIIAFARAILAAGHPPSTASAAPAIQVQEFPYGAVSEISAYQYGASQQESLNPGGAWMALAALASKVCK